VSREMTDGLRQAGRETGSIPRSSRRGASWATW
jgi:hypothetical protein